MQILHFVYGIHLTLLNTFKKEIEKKDNKGGKRGKNGGGEGKVLTNPTRVNIYKEIMHFMHGP